MTTVDPPHALAARRTESRGGTLERSPESVKVGRGRRASPRQQRFPVPCPPPARRISKGSPCRALRQPAASARVPPAVPSASPPRQQGFPVPCSPPARRVSKGSPCLPQPEAPSAGGPVPEVRSFTLHRSFGIDTNPSLGHGVSGPTSPLPKPADVRSCRNAAEWRGAIRYRSLAPTAPRGLPPGHSPGKLPRSTSFG